MENLYKKCKCEEDPTCYVCYGSGQVRDYELEAIRYQKLQKQDKYCKHCEYPCNWEAEPGNGTEYAKYCRLGEDS